MSQNLKVKRFKFEFTRPNDTTTYTAQDCVSDSTTAPTTFALVSQNPDGTTPTFTLNPGGSYQIKTVKLTASSVTTTNANFDLYFYTSGVTNTNDNAAMPLLYSNKEGRIGKTSMVLATAGTGSDCAESTNTDVNLTFIAQATTIYMKVLVTAAYVPIARENFFIEVEIIRLND